MRKQIIIASLLVGTMMGSFIAATSYAGIGDVRFSVEIGMSSFLLFSSEMYFIAMWGLRTK